MSLHHRIARLWLVATETKVNLMKSFLIDRYTKGGALRLGESPEPELRENDVIVVIHAAGVNLLDNKIRDGEFKLILLYRLPLVLGNDVAGVVVRVGANVRQFKPGDEVYAYSSPLRSVTNTLCFQESRVGTTRPTPFPLRVGA
jgi:NADPH:quinone reductase-like Zn-dependent oxidoreductase